jgi:hypothetical protein
MSAQYVIQWKSRVNGRAGKGNKLFSREEAEQLAEELNEEYPDIEHLILDAAAEENRVAQPTNQTQEEEPTEQAEQATPPEPTSSQVPSLHESWQP